MCLIITWWRLLRQFLPRNLITSVSKGTADTVRTTASALDRVRDFLITSVSTLPIYIICIITILIQLLWNMVQMKSERIMNPRLLELSLINIKRKSFLTVFDLLQKIKMLKCSSEYARFPWYRKLRFVTCSYFYTIVIDRKMRLPVILWAFLELTSASSSSFVDPNCP